MSKYLEDKAKKELKDILSVFGLEGDFQWEMRGKTLTAKQYNPKWDGNNDMEGVPVYSGKVLKFKIESTSK